VTVEKRRNTRHALARKKETGRAVRERPEKKEQSSFSVPPTGLRPNAAGGDKTQWCEKRGRPGERGRGRGAKVNQAKAK